MRSGADLRGASPLVSFEDVIDPHFVASPAVCIQQFATLNLTLTLTFSSNPDPDPNPDPNLTPILTLNVTLQ